MPNWCRNELKISAYSFENGEVKIEALLDFLKETIPAYLDRLKAIAEEDKKFKTNNRFSSHNSRSIFDFNNIIPYPEEFKQKDRDYITLSAEEYEKKYKTKYDGFNDDGYNWRVKFWGTKWGAVNAVWVPEHKTFYFDTAWAPPFPVLCELHRKFPNTTFYFEYYESGSATMGGCEFLAQEDWYPGDCSLEEVTSIDQYRNRQMLPEDTSWKPGVMYNPWSMDYIGFKGG